MPPHQIPLNSNLAQWLVQAIVRLFATSALVQGVGILIGGAERWAGPAFQSALQFPGAPESWGVLLVLAGSLTILSSLKAWRIRVIVGLYLLATWYLFFGATQMDAVRDNPQASPFGAIANLTAAALFITLGAAHKLEKR